MTPEIQLPELPPAAAQPEPISSTAQSSSQAPASMANLADGIEDRAGPLTS